MRVIVSGDWFPVRLLCDGTDILCLFLSSAQIALNNHVSTVWAASMPAPAGNFEQRHERYRALARGAREAGRVLVAFCDGALTADQLVGAYGWLVAVSDGAGGLEVLAAGGGSAVADDCTNVLAIKFERDIVISEAAHAASGKQPCPALAKQLCS